MTTTFEPDRPYRPVDKPFAVRLVELARALQLVRDSLLALRRGQIYYAPALSGQLRALLTERAGGADPLLLEVASVLEHPLTVFCGPDVDDPNFPADLRDDLVVLMHGFPVTARRRSPRQKELPFSEFLNMAVLLFKGRKYTPSTVIEWYANKAGGAHYSRTIPADFAELSALNAAGIQPLMNVLTQVADATLLAGVGLLKKVTDFEMHAVIVVPDCAPRQDVTYLFDAVYPGSSMRVTVALTSDRIPVVRAIGLQQSGLVVEAGELVDWGTPRYLHVALAIDEDLSTSLELNVDGERVAYGRSPEPLLVLSDPRDYEYFQNRAADGGPQDFEFGVSEVALYSREHRAVDRANLLLWFDDSRTRDHPLMIYTPGPFGHAPRGTQNIAMTGAVRCGCVRDLLPNFEPKIECSADTREGG
jgi:hypothetical protein